MAQYEFFEHEGVLPDGSFDDERSGGVEVNGCIVISEPSCGCDDVNCDCSPGHWMTILMPRTSIGTVRGIKVKFDSREELEHTIIN